MYRLFQTHNVRRTLSLPQMWDFKTLDRADPVNMRIPVPSCVESIPELSSYKGKCELKTQRHFGGSIRLTFKGVSHTAQVSLDGKVLGTHYGAYGEFSYVLPDLCYENHEITVTAHNAYNEDSALHVENDYYSYLGITRPVVLEQLRNAYIKWLHVTPAFHDNCWSVTVTASIENISCREIHTRLALYLSENDTPVTHKQPNGMVPVTLPPGETMEYTHTFPCANIKEYSPSQPFLYFLHGVLLDADCNPGVVRNPSCESDVSGDTIVINCCPKPIDDMIERFGFREVKVSGTQILWNNTPITIKGFNRHEDYAEFGCCVPLDAMYRDICLIKDTGANCIRTCHYPNDERFLDLCDENGLFVWEEAHARGLSEEQMRNPHFDEQSSLSIQEMITSHYNHPSIFIWGLLNECASDTQYGRSCYEKQIAQIRSLDSSRPVTFASCRFNTDICLDLVDVVSYNYYPGWYHNTPVTDYLKEGYQWIQTTLGAGKPFLVSEIGAGAIYGYRSATHCKWSEEYQAQALQEQITSVLSFPKCSGVILWQYADCRVDESWFANRPKSQNNKGIVDMYRREKLSYAVVKRLFGQHKAEV